MAHSRFEPALPGPFGNAKLKRRAIASMKERMNNEHGEFEPHLRDLLMVQGDNRLNPPVEICPGVKLLGCTRKASVLHELIRDGRFGPELGRGIQALIPDEERTAVFSDYEFRLLHEQGYWYALYSIAKKGRRELAGLAFEASGVVTEDTKAEMWRILGLAEELSRELLAEHLKGAG